MLSSALNPDRATLNFLNAYAEEVRNEGERLQKDGAVTQIFGNHLYIQGRVETKSGTYRTSLRLQGNRWFGSCTAEDERTAGICLIATMIERMYRGANMPESPNELNEIPLSDLIEEKLGRDLDDREADFVTKLEKRYRRFAIEQELHDHDLVRLNPRWEITGYEALELWPTPPHNILEFWNYIAYAFTKKRIAYPDFMNVVTDLEKVQRRISQWEREKEIGTWYDRIQSVNERPPQPPRHAMHMRLVSTINEAHFEYRFLDNEDWIPVRERSQLDMLMDEFLRGALKCDPQSDILLNVLSDYADREETVVLDLDKEAACCVMNRLFHQPALRATSSTSTNATSRSFASRSSGSASTTPSSPTAMGCNSSLLPGYSSPTRCASCRGRSSSTNPTKPSSPALPAGSKAQKWSRATPSRKPSSTAWTAWSSCAKSAPPCPRAWRNASSTSSCAPPSA